MGHWHCGHNMPGYLPESDVMCSDTTEWAMQIWHGEVHRAADDLLDDGDFLAIDTTQALVTVADLESNGSVSIDVENYRYWVEPAEGTHADCELAFE